MLEAKIAEEEIRHKLRLFYRQNHIPNSVEDSIGSKAALQQGLTYIDSASSEDHLTAFSYLVPSVQLDPTNADAWGALARLGIEYATLPAGNGMVALDSQIVRNTRKMIKSVGDSRSDAPYPLRAHLDYKMCCFSEAVKSFDQAAKSGIPERMLPQAARTYAILGRFDSFADLGRGAGFPESLEESYAAVALSALNLKKAEDALKIFHEIKDNGRNVDYYIMLIGSLKSKVSDRKSVGNVTYLNETSPQKERIVLRNFENIIYLLSKKAKEISGLDLDNYVNALADRLSIETKPLMHILSGQVPEIIMTSHYPGVLSDWKDFSNYLIHNSEEFAPLFYQIMNGIEFHEINQQAYGVLRCATPKEKSIKFDDPLHKSLMLISDINIPGQFEITLVNRSAYNTPSGKVDFQNLLQKQYKRKLHNIDISGAYNFFFAK